MFSFWKKDKGSVQETEIAGEEAIGQAERAALTQRAASLQARLETVEGEARAACLNAVAEVYLALDDIDQAIRCYEESIAESRTLGKAYTDLLQLYNRKRKAAANAGDDAQLQRYLSKIDGLMKLTKDAVRGA